MPTLTRLAAIALTLLLATHARAEKSPAADPSKVDADFALQGEYVGDVTNDDGKGKWGAHVIALGDHKFRLVAYRGGLPGDGWETDRGVLTAEAESKDGSITFRGDEFGPWAITVRDDGMTSVNTENADQNGKLEKVIRKSPTLGAKPPPGAIILFDGKTNAFDKPATEDGFLPQGVNTKQKFGACTLHLEFRLPYEPKGRGQGRGNSGCYMQGRYEVQILDSFGLAGKNNECGGLYGIKDPDVNMCYPPLSWQTYDIDYTPAEYKDGQKTKSATITVRHNGVLIHKDVELPKPTTAAPMKDGPESGIIHLQDHGHPLRFQNIWLVEKK